MKGFLTVIILAFNVVNCSRNVSKKRRNENSAEISANIVVESPEAFYQEKRSRTENTSFRFNFPLNQDQEVQVQEIEVSQPCRDQIFAHFEHFDKRRVDEILTTDYDIFENGIWDDLIALKHYKAIKYMLINYFVSDSFHVETFEKALKTGSTALALFLLKESTRVLKDANDRLINLACKYKRYKILRAMGKADFNPNFVAKRGSGKFQLHLAVVEDNFRLARILLKFNRCEVECPDYDGNTPIHYVRSVEMAELLMEHGADPMNVNINDRTAIELAAQKHNYDLVRTLERDLGRRLSLFISSNAKTERFRGSKTFLVGRQNVLEDSFMVTNRENNWYKTAFGSKYIYKVKFYGETGIDNGGPTREWFSLLIDRFFVPRLPSDDETEESEESRNESESLEEGEVVEDQEEGEIAEIDVDSDNDYFNGDIYTQIYDGYGYESELSEIEPDGDCEPFYNAPFECVDLENKIYTISTKFTGPIEVYKFIGSVIGKSFLKMIPLKVKIVPSLMKLIMGRALTFADLEADDPVMYKSMLHCLKPDFDFESAFYTLPSDESISVHRGNVKRFLDETAVNAMYYRHREQIDQLILGFRSVVNHRALSAYFSPEEVVEILQGHEEISVADMKKAIELSGLVWLSRSEMFWDAIGMLEPFELLQLVQFITGINGLPYGGLPALGKQLKVFDLITGDFPRSSTCNYHLSIPVSIQSAVELVEKLRISLNSTPEFIDVDFCCCY